MGLFGSIGRAIGRGLGRVVEKVGDLTGSETLQRVGQGIQTACEEVSYDTGNTDKYEKESARTEDTKKINMILAEFSLKLEKKADEIEKTAIKESKVYFEELISELHNSESEIKINVNRIERTMSKVEKEIKGNLKLYISKRVSIDDSECLEVLKMNAGTEKENAMKDFSKKILQLGLKNLVQDIKNVIREQNDIITDVIQEKLEDMKLNLDKKIQEFNMLEDSKLKTEEEVKKLKDELIIKMQLSEACIDSLN